MKALLAATGLIFLGCAVSGPGSYGSAEYPLEIYTIGDTMNKHQARALEARVAARLKQEGLWSDVDRLVVDKYGVHLWAAVNVHIRFPDLLSELTQVRR